MSTLSTDAHRSCWSASSGSDLLHREAGSGPRQIDPAGGFLVAAPSPALFASALVRSQKSCAKNVHPPVVILTSWTRPVYEAPRKNLVMPPHRELLISTRQFAQERRWRSWWAVGSTLALATVLFAIATGTLNWPTRLLASLLLGLTVVRVFVIYHDFQHGAILRRSSAARLLMQLIGLILLTPPSSWNRSHNHHHAHNSKLSAPDIGTDPLMSVAEFGRTTRRQKALYVAQRHPLTMCCGYLTVFCIGMCVRPFLTNPRRHRDGAASIVCHSALLVWLGCRGLDDLLLAALLPFSLASAIGPYLFYAQHNYPDAQVNPAGHWEYATAALDSSSYIKMGSLMNWFTANIGYHHVHHLNSRIPLYRLPEAMHALPALQVAGTSSLKTADIRACLRLKLWDPVAGQLVPWGDSRQT